MQEERSKLQNFLHSPTFFIIAGLSIVLLVVATILLLPKDKTDPDSYIDTSISSIPVTNFTEFFPDLDNVYQQNLEGALYVQARRDSSIPNSTTTATIRKDSLTNVDYNDYHTGDFIIDIEGLQISYLVLFKYGSLAGRSYEDFAFSTLYCLPEDQRIYPTANCSAKTDYSRPTIKGIKEFESSLDFNNE